MSELDLQPPSNENPDHDDQGAKRRGRIPRSAWQGIVDRYRGGETLSAIADNYGCTASAISYIIRKAEESGIEPQESGDLAEAAAPPPSSAPTAAAPAAALRPAESRTVFVDPRPGIAQRHQPVDLRQPGAAPPVHESRTLTMPVNAEPRAVPRPAAPPQSPAAQSAATQGPGSQNPGPQQPRASIAGEAAAPQQRPPAQTAHQSHHRPPMMPPQTPRHDAGPVENVEERLRDTATCLQDQYKKWRSQPGEVSYQELYDSLHEMRKVLSRVEIEMSASRREEQIARPIPIPPHRTARGGGNNGNGNGG